MVAIRLSRTGAKKKPSYRVVVMDKRRARDSRNIEIVGHYNPRPTPIELVLKRDRIDYWLAVGAQPSATVQRLVRHFDEKIVPMEPVEEESQTDAVEAVPEAAPAPEAEPDKPAQPGAPVAGDAVEESDEALDEEIEAALAEEATAGRPAPSAEPAEEPEAAEDAAAEADSADATAPEEAVAIEDESESQEAAAPQEAEAPSTDDDSAGGAKAEAEAASE